jgi:hypothetical protein
VDPVPDPLLLRKSGSAGNRTKDFWVRNHELWPLDDTDLSDISHNIPFLSFAFQTASFLNKVSLKCCTPFSSLQSVYFWARNLNAAPVSLTEVTCGVFWVPSGRVWDSISMRPRKHLSDFLQFNNHFTVTRYKDQPLIATSVIQKRSLNYSLVTDITITTVDISHRPVFDLKTRRFGDSFLLVLRDRR